VAIKVKIPRSAPAKGRKGRLHLSSRLIKIVVASLIVLCTMMIGVFAVYYVHYEKIIDRRMSGQIFSNSAKIYALPQTVSVGQQITPHEIAGELRRAGYMELGTKDPESKIGMYKLISGGIEIRPGPESYHTAEVSRVYVDVNSHKVEHILAEGKEASDYELEPKLVTALFDSGQRSKRQLVKYNEIPKIMVDAVLAIEDRRFFEHSGVNYGRVAQAAWVDFRTGGRGQGASTLTMQMARAFFLSPEKTMKRKITEMLIAFELEQKFSKQQIFELYANQVDLGQRGSFTIVGFAEAARAYFNKDLQSITLPEAALIAGIIQRPSYLNPYRHLERATDRRNLVLDAMVETGAISRAAAEKAKAEPVKLAPPNVEASDAPYFVDLVKDTLSAKYPEQELNQNGYRIYTSIDPDLQSVAAEAVSEGVKIVDEQVTKQRTHKKKIGKGKNATTETTISPGPQAQVALVAIDPHTGDVLALVGGRNYGFSQLNHAVAKRPTGSIFKPFVYAAAMNTALNPDAQPANASNPPTQNTVETPVSLIDDSPSTFMYGDQIYEPRNYRNEYHGQVTARYALQMSLNNATVKLAETVGYDKVAELAKSAGITSVKATPAMALGAYDATPLDMAGAYTVFANDGNRISPMMIRSVRNANGDVVEDFQPQSKPVLDPRVAFVVTTMMETVLNNGTGYEVRKRGFTAPAAGKTGTSHDAWFAGYTSNLLCIVWVGYDDYSDLKLSGGTTAAPIWAEFMKRAVKLPTYRDAKPFQQPSGVVDVQVDKVTNRLSTPSCPETVTVAFIAGTEPKDTCEQATGDQRNVFQKLFGMGNSQPAPPPTTNGPVNGRPGGQPMTAGQAQVQAQQQQQQDQQKKKGLFGKIIGAIKGDDDKNKQPQPPQPQPR
jgi:penicillin-binding protein 1B